MNNAIFWKTIENVRKHRRKRRNYLVSEPNYHTTMFFRKNSLAIEMEKQQQQQKNRYLWTNLSI